VAGISTFTVTKQVLEGSAIIDKTSLEPNLSLAATMKDLPAGQQLLLSLSSDPSNLPLQAQITQPDGKVLAAFDIKETPFTSTATTSISGDYTLQVKNVGSRPVTVSGALINSPLAQQGGGVGVQDKASVGSFIAFGIWILVGIVLIIAGVVLLIIGTINYVRGRKTAPPNTSVQ
jgi:hypothetical protein